MRAVHTEASRLAPSFSVGWMENKILALHAQSMRPSAKRANTSLGQLRAQDKVCPDTAREPAQGKAVQKKKRRSQILVSTKKELERAKKPPTKVPPIKVQIERILEFTLRSERRLVELGAGCSPPNTASDSITFWKHVSCDMRMKFGMTRQHVANVLNTSKSGDELISLKVISRPCEGRAEQHYYIIRVKEGQTNIYDNTAFKSLVGDNVALSSSGVLTRDWVNEVFGFFFW